MQIIENGQSGPNLAPVIVRSISITNTPRPMLRPIYTLIPLVLLLVQVPEVHGQCTTTNATSCQCPGGGQECDLLPDLTISWYGLMNYLDGPSEVAGRVRISGSTPNIGLGPMEVRGVDMNGYRRFTCGVDTFEVYDPNAQQQFTCPGGGTAKQLSTQRVFHKNGAQMTSYERVMDQGMTYTSTQGNVRYDQWGIYSLRMPEYGVSDPREWPIINQGYKLGFCLMDYNNCGQAVVNHHCKDDNTQYNSGTTLSSPTDFPNYGLGGGNYSCSMVRQGISSGYTDIYSEYLDGMWIDIPSGTCNGEYWIVYEVDPLDRVLESDEGNNYTAVPFTLTQQTATSPIATITSEEQAYVCSGGEVRLRANAGLAYQWSTGAITNSIQAGPGTYTVTVTTYCGTAVSQPFTVTELAQPPVPVVGTAIICEGEQAALLSSEPNSLWYDATGSLVGSGPIFETPPLYASTTYQVAAVNEAPGTVLYGGKQNNAGSGEYHAGAQRLDLSALQAFRLKSVKVYAGSAGWRTVELLDAIGVLRNTRSVWVPAGESRITLDFDIAPGNGYKLVVAGTADLWRSSAGVSYPYAIGDVATITGGSGGSSYYYYFYDWEVHFGGGVCIGEPVPVTVDVEICTGVAEVLTLRGFQVYPNPNMGSFTVELHLLQDTHVELTLVDVLGHVVHTSSATAAAGQWKHAMALEGLSSGIYHLNVDLVGRRFSERIVVQ